MTGYSIATLKWGLERLYDRDMREGRQPFSRMIASYWSTTSGHTGETIEALKTQIARDRETRVEPAVDPVFVGDGK